MARRIISSSTFILCSSNATNNNNNNVNHVECKSAIVLSKTISYIDSESYWLLKLAKLAISLSFQMIYRPKSKIILPMQHRIQ